jgi:hypothetical protein
MRICSRRDLIRANVLLVTSKLQVAAPKLTRTRVKLTLKRAQSSRHTLRRDLIRANV